MYVYAYPYMTIYYTVCTDKSFQMWKKMITDTVILGFKKLLK